jgi:hypothetical protein
MGFCLSAAVRLNERSDNFAAVAVSDAARGGPDSLRAWRTEFNMFKLFKWFKTF